jgi:hypothetical protein
MAPSDDFSFSTRPDATILTDVDWQTSENADRSPEVL